MVSKKSTINLQFEFSDTKCFFFFAKREQNNINSTSLGEPNKIFGLPNAGSYSNKNFLQLKSESIKVTIEIVYYKKYVNIIISNDYIVI